MYLTPKLGRRRYQYAPPWSDRILTTVVGVREADMLQLLLQRLLYLAYSLANDAREV